MTASADSIAKPKSRAVAFARIFTWLAVALFLLACSLSPRGITVPWGVYLFMFGPVVAVDLTAIFGFAFCRDINQRISFAYLLMSLLVLAGVWFVTWFVLRLRWWEVFRS